MQGFKIIPDNSDNTAPNVFVVKNDSNSGGLNDVLNNWMGEQLRKTLEGKKDKKEEGDGKKQPHYSRYEVMCYSLLLLATSPWTGLYILKALENAKAGWAQILMPH